MDLSKDHSEFLARYQSLAFSPKLEDGSPSEKADIIRQTIAQLQYAQLSGLMEDVAVRPLIRQFETMYANIVDCFDEGKGLNNFAEGALSLCSGKKNESKDWKTSLSVDKILAMKTVQQHVSKTQVQREKYLPKSKREEVLPLNFQNKENALGGANQPQKGASSSKPPPGGATLSKPPPSGQAPASRPTQSNQSTRVMNLYENQPGVDQRGPAQPSYARTGNQLAPTGRLDPAPSSYARTGNQSAATGRPDPAQSSYTRNTPASEPPQNFNRESNRKPLFSGGVKQAAFGQYKAGQNQAGYDMNNFEPQGGPRPPQYGGQPQPQPPDRYEEDRPAAAAHNVFKTAKQQLAIDQQKKHGGGAGGRGSVGPTAYGTGKKSLGTRRGLNSKFVPPVMNREDENDEGFSNTAANTITRAVLKTGGAGNEGSGSGAGNSKMEGLDEDKLKGVEAKMVEMIMNEIMDNGPPLTWDDVAGLEFAKKTIKEIVVWPMLRPDIFTGLRGPPKGLLLFGPPGTGKTLIGKCIASQSKSTFFCISASSLTSKWVGEGEKMVRALFAVARAQQPAVVFIDEIDSLLTQRTDGENEASRRIKTEFLVQLDGASTSADDRILVIGATNRPQEIDEAARRRFVKRLYIPLPELPARKTIIVNLLREQSNHLTDDELHTICDNTAGFSGADMATLCREAALGPIRDMSFGDIEHISADQVRPITHGDFQDALQNVKPSVSDKDLDQYLEWNKTFGSGSR